MIPKRRGVNLSLTPLLFCPLQSSRLTVSVESLGAYAPEELLTESINVLLGKISSVEGCLKALQSQIPASA